MAAPARLVISSPIAMRPEALNLQNATIETSTIKATIHIELPRGFQTSEFLLEHGFVDRIVRRQDLKSEIARTIDYCGK